ncbi:MAG TPA: flavodoxin family protein [Bacillota bacterium]|nr:flavodoxin family protein [Bacillota bacterium]
MKILGIVGSYRKGGNTDLLTEAILASAAGHGAETEKVFIDDLKMGSCRGCMECRKDGICCQEDDVAGLVAKIDQADGVVFGSPIYGNYITGQAKILLDRLMGVINKTTFVPGKGPVKVSRLKPKKRNVVILMAIGAERPESADDALKLVRRMLSSFANGGTVEELRATGLMDKGQVGMLEAELAAIARKQNPSADIQAKAAEMNLHNQELLKMAGELGAGLIQ